MAAQRGEKLKKNIILHLILIFLFCSGVFLSLAEDFELEIGVDKSEISLLSEKRDNQLAELMKKLSAKIASQGENFDIRLLCENEEILKLSSLDGKKYLNEKKAALPLDFSGEIIPAQLRLLIAPQLSSKLDLSELNKKELFIKRLFSLIKQLDESFSNAEAEEKRGARLFDGEKKSSAQKVYSIDSAACEGLKKGELKELLNNISLAKPMKISRHLNDEGAAIGYQLKGEAEISGIAYSLKLKIMNGNSALRLEAELSNKNENMSLNAKQKKEELDFSSSLEIKRKGERKQVYSLNALEKDGETLVSFSKSYQFKNASKKSVIELNLNLKALENKDIAGELGYSNVKFFPHNIQTRQIINFPVKLHWNVTIPEIKSDAEALTESETKSLLAEAFFKLLRHVPSESRAEILHLLSSGFRYNSPEIKSPLSK